MASVANRIQNKVKTPFLMCFFFLIKLKLEQSSCLASFRKRFVKRRHTLIYEITHNRCVNTHICIDSYFVVHFKKQVSNHGVTVIVEVSWYDHLVDRRRLWLGKTTHSIRINRRINKKTTTTITTWTGWYWNSTFIAGQQHLFRNSYSIQPEPLEKVKPFIAAAGISFSSKCSSP